MKSENSLKSDNCVCKMIPYDPKMYYYDCKYNFNNCKLNYCVK